jgi:hypothetical protein
MGARAATHVRATYTLAGLTSSTLQVYETVLTRRGTL